jgi:6-phosphogluconolactonase
MRLAFEVVSGAEVADRAARHIVQAIRASAGRCSIALSGGSTPVAMFHRLAAAEVDWERVDLFQVDERVAPDGHPARNSILIERELLSHIEGPSPAVHPMPVAGDDLEGAANRYGEELEATCGRPPVLDVVHLGLGADGHIASLMPGDLVLDVRDRWVAVTDVHAGFRRMTLTFPTLDEARLVVVLATGEEKAVAVAGWVADDHVIPATRLRAGEIVVVTDVPPDALTRPEKGTDSKGPILT